MSLATVSSRAVIGIDAVPVTVETHLSNGLPGFAIVGLPETAVRESKERVRSAIINSGLNFPERRITVNLAPADLPKAGGQFDFAIALSILVASHQLPEEPLHDVEIMGELALNGRLRKITGAVPALLAARKATKSMILPSANQSEIRLVAYDKAHSTNSLLEYVNHLHNGDELDSPGQSQAVPMHAQATTFLQVKGQIQARRAVQIAAAGRHNLLLIGPPGCGKTMLARNLTRLLPALSDDEAMEVAAIRSICKTDSGCDGIIQRPLRIPHHSATYVSLVGGGHRAHPGEVTLAHRGVLFLDEFSEFKPSALDALRESLESGEVTVSRANYRITYPADFQLVAAMNPCPCGYASDPNRECLCPPDKVRRYLSKLSGPLLDRIDIIVELASLTHAELLLEPGHGEEFQSGWSKARDLIARTQQKQKSRSGKLNNALDADDLQVHCRLDESLKQGLAKAMDELRLSARGVHRILKVARTIADYEGAEEIDQAHLFEAIAYRRHGDLNKIAAE